MAQIEHRLSPVLLEQIKAKLGGDAMTKVTPQTTELMVSWQMGVQHVLAILEKGFTTTVQTS
ncbi:hypothetical protein IVIADoCa7_39 [Xanthomonas phage vB_Xar_IVIA-DoCa7]|uniref:Uncharacterized protein n=1 Tax=Xanthomonas phage vB_Xar_IVIA-DoCa7 TaxID=2975534 RepID=A0A9X9JN33_9CAUD|nr:hypothetical protein IVIADoCa7_39 [Xanthomonas phage vB_Xar_IVIA-DoCa7]